VEPLALHPKFTGPVVLGSRSPRRRDLLGSMLKPHQLIILPPFSADEQGFEGLSTEGQIEDRLLTVVATKHQDVLRQVQDRDDLHSAAVVAADTIVIAQPSDGTRLVLGQPGPIDWQADVHTWFSNFLSDRTHQVWTGLCVSHEAKTVHRIVRSQVTFCRLTPELTEWYIATGESIGKAGGYAIQGYGAALVHRLEGSLTNVIGLPLLEVMEAIYEVTQASPET
jgi:septum formation protein